MKFIVLFALVAVACAQGYNKLNYKLNGQSLVLNGQNVYGGGLSSGGYGGSRYGGSSFRSSGSGYGSGYGGGAQVVLAQVAPVSRYGYAQASYGGARQSNYAQSSGPVYAAVQSTRNVQYVDGPSAQPAQPQSIIIGPSVQPLDFEFQSQSSPINVRQTHIPGQPGAPQESSHTEEPDVLRQTITKPLIHEVHEEIQPVRRISQVVNPVQEEINQLVTRGQQQQTYQQQSYVQPQVQAIRVAAVQPAVQTVQLIAQPGYSTGYQTGGYSGLSGLSGLSGGYSGLSGLTLGGGNTGYSTSEYSTDNY